MYNTLAPDDVSLRPEGDDDALVERAPLDLVDVLRMLAVRIVDAALRLPRFWIDVVDDTHRSLGFYRVYFLVPYVVYGAVIVLFLDKLAKRMDRAVFADHAQAQAAVVCAIFYHVVLY